MAFFARPNLDDTQFKQLPDSVLSLSGLTQVQNITGLTISDENGVQIPIVVTGATNEYVLTYDSVTANVRLKPSASAAAFNYSGASPTTCTVGGLPENTPIFNCPINEILQCILVPTKYPVLEDPSISSLYLIPALPTIYEIGSTPNLCACTDFCPGTMNPVYPPTPSGCCRSDGTWCYTYDVFGTPCANQCVVNSPSNLMPFGSLLINSPSNTISVTVHYRCGAQPYDSAGNPYCSPLPSGSTNLCTTGTVASKTLTGVYPWYWGTSTTAPNVSTSGCTQCLINSYTCKCVASSTGTICVNNFNVTGKYIWFATPYASASKTCWQGANNPSNNGVIPGALFPSIACWNIVSPESCWGSTCYKIYVSGYATDINYGMTFCN